jgi:hypothetical protein
MIRLIIRLDRMRIPGRTERKCLKIYYAEKYMLRNLEYVILASLRDVQELRGIKGD